ncbi:hypothetical protein B0H10DRAFT_1948850 [Mycena sp. CBHHK59/15]|nr:hypothetical protein B0H10DRAFT_1948850 [Mycena sp. CBHHK59/15]
MGDAVVKPQKHSSFVNKKIAWMVILPRGPEIYQRGCVHTGWQEGREKMWKKEKEVWCSPMDTKDSDRNSIDNEAQLGLMMFCWHNTPVATWQRSLPAAREGWVAQEGENSYIGLGSSITVSVVIIPARESKGDEMEGDSSGVVVHVGEDSCWHCLVHQLYSDGLREILIIRGQYKRLALERRHGLGVRWTSIQGREKLVDHTSHLVTFNIGWTPKSGKSSHPPFEVSFDEILTSVARRRFNGDFVLFYW